MWKWKEIQKLSWKWVGLIIKDGELVEYTI